MSPQHIHPIDERLVSRREQELLLNQKGKVLWFTGLSGSGKSTIVIALESALYDRGYFVKVLDGDNIRAGINSNLGFSTEDRTENIRRIAEVAKLFVDCGVIVLCAFVSPTREMRATARAIVGSSDFIEVFVDTPLEECERRDVKGLYKKARAGQIQDFTGIHDPYEAPDQPDVHLPTALVTVADSVEKLIDILS